MNSRPYTHDPSAFVGRRSELRQLALLRAELEGHRERPRHLVVIEGFEGAGSTSVVAEFLRRLDEDDRTYTARTAYSAAFRRAPLEPIVDAVDALLSANLNNRRLRALFSDPSLQPLLRRLPLVQSSLDIDPDVTASTFDAETFAGLLGALVSQLARFRPVVISIDNLHLIPDDDIPLFASLNLALRNEAILLVSTAHRERMSRSRMIERLEGLIRETIYLPPLSAGEVAAMITRLHGALASSLIGSDISGASQGLPRRVHDLLRGLVDDGALVRQSDGDWQVSESYSASLLRRERTSSERIDSLPTVERAILAILNLRGRSASRADLASWCADLLVRRGEREGADIDRALERLEEEGILRPFLYGPALVAFAEEGLAEAERSMRDESLLDDIAAMVVAGNNLDFEVGNWAFDLDLIDRIIRSLPDEKARREEIIVGLTSFAGLRRNESDSDYHGRVLHVILDHRELLRPPEEVYAILQIVDVETTFTRFMPALEYARRAYEMTHAHESCFHLRAEACSAYALARFYVDRSTDVSELLAEGERCLELLADPERRLAAEFRLVKNSLTTIPVDRAREAIDFAARAYRIAERMKYSVEKYTILSDLILRFSRLRDGENLRRYCGQLMEAIQEGRGEMRPPVWMISNAIRAALNFGDLFLARNLLSAWNRGEAPIEPRDYIAHGYLIVLFTLNDGDPESAAEWGRRVRSEIHRLRTAGVPISYEILFNYQAVQVYLIASLIYAGRHFQALETVGSILDEIEHGGTTPNTTEVAVVLRFYRAWLRWRTSLPADARTSLAWEESGAGEERRSERVEGSDCEFLQLHANEASKASPPPRFIIEMLHTELHVAQGRFDMALEALEQAKIACDRIYSWRNDVECQAVRVTLLLRRALSDGQRREEDVEGAVAAARELFRAMAERGMSERIEMLTRLFQAEGRRLTPVAGRDLAAQFDRMGSTALSTARVVLRNSTTENTGPIDRARLSVMGPMRLMRPHSYLELTDSAFGRETARTLILALVAASLQDRQPSREELQVQLSPTLHNPEQSKKILYNAVSAARAAFASPNAILNVGSGSIELNMDLDRSGAVWVDALEIQSSVLRAEKFEKRGELGAALGHFRRALILARRGEFGVECYHEWIDPARDIMRELVRRASLSVAEIAIRSGQYPLGIDAASSLLLRDPYDEEAHRLLIRLYSDSGNRSAALKQFEKCRKIIRSEFGVDVEPETRQIWMAIKN